METTNIFPLSFCVPDECIVESIPEKTNLLASLIPGDTSTYIFYGKKKNIMKCIVLQDLLLQK